MGKNIPKPELHRRCASGAALRIEMDIYPRDKLFTVDLYTDCPVHNFAQTRAAMAAAIEYLHKQMREQRKCPFHPDNEPLDKSHGNG